VTESLRVVSVTADAGFDPAMDVEEYAATRDPRLVRVAPGETVTWWTLRPLPASQVASISAQPEGMAELLAFTAALEDVDDPVFATKLRWTTRGNERHVEIASLDAVVPQAVIAELGALALERGELTLGENCRFAAPRGLQQMRTRLAGTSAKRASGSEASHPAE